MSSANYQSSFGTLDLAGSVGSNFVPREAPLCRAESHEVATLVFDSAHAAATAGVRGAFTSARQLLYRSGTVCIDMRMQPKPGTDSVVLVGQLLDSARPTSGMGDIPVSLVSDGGTVAYRKTNNFGEFDFGFETLHNTRLIVGIGKRRTIVVPVPDGEIEVASSDVGSSRQPGLLPHHRPP
jgi:hypothetical protein